MFRWYVSLVCFVGMVRWYVSLVRFVGTFRWYVSLVCFVGMFPLVVLVSSFQIVSSPRLFRCSCWRHSKDIAQTPPSSFQYC